MAAFAWLAIGCQDAGGDAGDGLPNPLDNGPQPANAGGAPGITGGSGGAGAVAPPPWMAAGSQAPLVPDVPGVPLAGSAAPVMPEPEIPRPDGWQEASHARGAMPDYARLFADDQVQRIDIEMSAAAKQDMDDDLEMLLGGNMGGFPGGGQPGGGVPAGPIDLIGGEPIYVPVTIRYQDRAWTQVGMRLKGNSSLAGAFRTGIKKFGFRLDFDRYEDEHPGTLDQRFYGFAKMTFSSGYNDPSLIRDKLAGEILASQGLTTARCAFYRIYVDSGAGPEYWGLYTMIEDPSDQLIETQFADDSGNLYKPDGPGATFKTFDMASFEKKSNEDAADYSDVMAVFSALHAPRNDAQAWRTGLEAVLDVDTFIDLLAVSRAIGHWDGYGAMAHNYYLYSDPADGGRLHWISWDHNLTWQTRSFRTVTVMMDEITDAWPLIRYLLDDPAYRMQYTQALQAALGNGYDKATFDARATALHQLITPAVVGGNGEPGEQAPFTFLSTPNAFRNALVNPNGGAGLISVAESFRQQIRDAIE